MGDINPVLEDVPVIHSMGLSEVPKQNDLTIVVDLDGVICPASVDDVDLLGHEPLPGARETLVALRGYGVRVIIWTARGEELRTMTEYWLETRNIPYDELRLDKPKASIYIDDKAFRFTGWSEVMEKLLLPRKDFDTPREE